jgi:hypothetical protein
MPWLGAWLFGHQRSEESASPSNLRATAERHSGRLAAEPRSPIGPACRRVAFQCRTFASGTLPCKVPHNLS